MNAPRVAYIIDSLGRGGTQTALRLLVDGLSARGFEQLVVSLNDDVDPVVRGALEASGARVLVIGRGALACGWGLVRLGLVLRRFAPHVVQTMLPYADILGRTAARCCTAARVVSSIRARNEDKRPWQFLLDRLTAPLAAKVVFNSRGVVDFSLRREGVRREQVVVIPNGVAVPTARAERSRELREALVPGGGGPVLLAVGRLYPQKDYFTMLAALAALRRELPTAVLLVAGIGPLREALERRAEDLGLGGAVRFLGRRDDVPELLGVADVFVHAARFEGLPNAVMEAMAAGLPVVATAVDGTLELVRHGRDGLLVPAGDYAAMARAVAELAADPARAAALGRAAQEKMREEFAPERMAAAYEALYRELSGV